MKKLLMLAILIGAALFGATAIARADVYEDAFLKVMHNAGFWHIDGDAGLLQAGYDVCEHLSLNGGDLDEATRYVYTHTGLSITPQKSGYLVGASVAAFCPGYGDNIKPGYVA